MLGKTAGGLYWMSRYLERSENVARLVEAGQRMALTRSSSDEEWTSILQTSGTAAGYHDKYDAVRRDHAIDWMLRDKDNPSSVLAVIDAARFNARLVRTALTRETWEAINGTWMLLNDLLKRKVGDRDLTEVLGRVRQRAAFVRGAMHGTLMRNDTYDFVRIGTFIERADNTARILDVKYYVLLPSAHAVGSSLDNVQWETILRSVSAEGSYMTAHGQEVKPREIAEFLILDRRMPRSLAFCTGKIRSNLNYLASDYAKSLPCHELAEQIGLTFTDVGVDAIFDQGLHQFIQDFLGATYRLGRQIEVDYRFYE